MSNEETWEEFLAWFLGEGKKHLDPRSALGRVVMNIEMSCLPIERPRYQWLSKIRIGLDFMNAEHHHWRARARRKGKDREASQ